MAISIGGSFLGPLFVHTALRQALLLDYAKSRPSSMPVCISSTQAQAMQLSPAAASTTCATCRVHTSLGCCRTDQESSGYAYGRNLRFLANVDPVDVARALNGLRPETTLVVVVSKTFTTAETMLNARTVRWACSLLVLQLSVRETPEVRLDTSLALLVVDLCAKHRALPSLCRQQTAFGSHLRCVLASCVTRRSSATNTLLLCVWQDVAHVSAG